MIKSAIVVPYFGKWPEWFELYLHSAANNPDLDIIFFSDIPLPANAPSNIQYHYTTFKEYCGRVSEKLGIDFHPDNPYKLCDLKPFYLYIHQDELKEYEYVGWGDIDLVYGKLDHFFTDEMMRRYKILSTHLDRFSGHFTLIKNSKEMIMKPFKIWRWKWILENQKNYGLDERLLTRYYTPLLILPRILKIRFGGKKITSLYKFLSRQLYPQYHFKEYHTTPFRSTNDYFYHNGQVNSSNGNELPYLHFLFFKKTQYDKSNKLYWKENFYQIDSQNLLNNDQIMINNKGIFPIKGKKEIKS